MRLIARFAFVVSSLFSGSAGSLPTAPINEKSVPGVEETARDL